MLDGEGRVFLIHRNTPKRTQWELPGGKIEEGEEPEQTAQREVLEELGVSVAIIKKLGEKSFEEDGYEMDYIWFLATIQDGIPTLKEEKFDALKYFSWDELKNKPALSANTKNLVEAYFTNGLNLHTNSMQDEYLDLVNEKDEIIGKKLRSEVYAEGLINFRVVNCFLVNSEGKLWIPRRTAAKRLFPLCLDVSMGGHVESGEEYDFSFKRELAEELNIDADITPWKMIGHLTPTEHEVSAHMNIYEIRTDEVPDFNPDDFTEYYWLTPEELLQKIAEGDGAKSDLPKIVRKFYLTK